MNSFTYKGNELELFSKALNWKHYFKNLIDPYISGNVLEVGSGICGTTRLFVDKKISSWTCLEPDKKLKLICKNNIEEFPKNFSVSDFDSMMSIPKNVFYDTILYIDVLEHIKDDKNEMNLAANHLSPGGKIIILSPAHQYLFSPFDKSIGHYRRYSKKSISYLIPPNFQQKSLLYIDSMGFFLSLINKIILRKKIPSSFQINFWSKYFIPISILLDKRIKFSFGKTVIAIWEKQ